MMMPVIFHRFFQKCAVIIDYFEIHMERPSDLLAHAQVWSNYKHHSMVKFSLGIIPQGKVLFIYESWCGQTSDKVLTKNSVVLDELIPGNVVLVDRVFTVDDYFHIVMAEVKLPPLTKGKKQ